MLRSSIHATLRRRTAPVRPGLGTCRRRSLAGSGCTRVGTLATRGIAAAILAACAGDRIAAPTEPACASGSSCAVAAAALQRVDVREALADAGARVVPALTDARLQADVRAALDALQADAAAGRVATARARLDALRARLDQAPIDDAIEVDALRLALAPAAAALGAPAFAVAHAPAN